MPFALNPEGAFSIGFKIGRRSCDLIIMDFVGGVHAALHETYPFPHPDFLVDFVRKGCPLLQAKLPARLHRRITGLGMNADELAANPRLTAWVVHDLNAEPCLPFADGEFDAAGCCVSIDYLVRPVEVLRDLARVLRPGSPLVITFSNRCFPTKVIALWGALDDAGHAQLVAHYLRAAGGWTDLVGLDRSPGAGDPLLAVVARRGAAAE